MIPDEPYLPEDKCELRSLLDLPQFRSIFVHHGLILMKSARVNPSPPTNPTCINSRREKCLGNSKQEFVFISVCLNEISLIKIYVQTSNNYPKKNKKKNIAMQYNAKKNLKYNYSIK